MTRTFRRSVLIACCAFALGLLVTVIVRREPMERLTHDTLLKAQATWHAAGLRDYDVRYELNGSAYDVEVRDGIVSEVLVDGVRPLTAAWENYSIDGLFDLLELEVDNLNDQAGPFAGAGDSMLAKVRFDEVLGYPAYYLRSGGGGRPAVVRVVEFKSVIH